MRWGGSVSVGVHAGLVVGLVLLPRPGRIVAPRRLEVLNIRLVPPTDVPGSDPPASAAATIVEPGRRRADARPAAEAPVAPAASAALPPAREDGEPARVASPAAVAREMVEIRVSTRSPLDPPPRRGPPASDGLAPTGGGGPRVDADGSVQFDDRSAPSIETNTPERLARTVKHELNEWMLDPYKYQRRLGRADAQETGRWTIKPTSPLAQPGDPDAKGTWIYIPLVWGKFDVTAAAERARGHDLDRHAKQQFLDRTRDARADMAVAERARLSGEATYRLSDRLAAIWDDARRTAPERRALLFELWEECDEGDAGRAARASIVGFIRRRLPAGSADAYPPDEIERLNARRGSAARFAPYGP